MIDAAAELLAREHRSAVDRGLLVPLTFLDAAACRNALTGLQTNGFSGVVAVEGGDCVGLMCVRSIDGVGFVPAHGFAVEPGAHEPTRIVVELLAALDPVFSARGTWRVTVDHVEHPHVTTALHDAGFGRVGVYAVRATARVNAATLIEVRTGSADDLDVIVALSHIELLHRFTPPIYGLDPIRTLDATRALHEELLEAGAVHLLACRDGVDVGLLTIERTAPAPRLCPPSGPYIGPTATHPDARRHGVGAALVAAAIDWAAAEGSATIGVDFDSANPLSRPFWVGNGFQPTGYRVRRVIKVPPRR